MLPVFVATPTGDLNEDQRDLLLYGTGADRVHVRYKNRYGRTRSYHAQVKARNPATVA